jgi:phage tail-like protein
MTTASAAAQYPLVAYNYRVVVGTVTMRFSKVEGLVWERTAIPYRDGLSFLDGEQLAICRVDAYSSLTLQQGLVATDTALYTWLKSGDPRLLQVQLCQANGQPVLAWQATRAIPVKLSGATLDASTNEVCIDTLELRTAGWSILTPS